MNTLTQSYRDTEKHRVDTTIVKPILLSFRRSVTYEESGNRKTNKDSSFAKGERRNDIKTITKHLNTLALSEVEMLTHKHI